MFTRAWFLRRWLWLCIVLALGITGCAETKFYSNVTPDTNGIRYYLPATYILIKPDYTKGEANVTYWIGPDTTALYAADPYSFLSTNTTELQFERGYLTSVSSQIDTTKVASDAINALDNLGKAVLTTAAKSAQLAAAAAAEEVTKPQIYLFVVGTDGSLRTLFSPELPWPEARRGAEKETK